MKKNLQAFMWGSAAGLMLVLGQKAHAMELPDVVGVHIATKHADSGKHAEGALGYRESNLGLYARWTNGLTLGAYRNSLYRDSAYIGYTIGDRFALTVGVVSGYDKVVTKGWDHDAIRCEDTCRSVHLKRVLSPLIVPSVRLGVWERTSLRLSLLVPPGQPTALHLSVEQKF